MPDEITTEETDAPQTGEQPAAPETPPGDDRVAKLELSFAELNGRYSSLQENYNVLLAQQASQNQGRIETPRETELVDVSDDDIQAAVEAGDGRKVAQLMRKQSQIAAERTMREFKAREVDPIQQAMGVGMTSLADHAMEIARPTLKHLKRFEKEINATLSRLDPGTRTNALMIKRAHDMLVGENFDTLIDEEIERRARAKVADPGVTPSTRRGGSERTPEPDDLNPDANGEIARHGGKDNFAMKFYGKPWNEYMADTAKYRRSA